MNSVAMHKNRSGITEADVIKAIKGKLYSGRKINIKLYTLEREGGFRLARARKGKILDLYPYIFTAC